MSRHLLSRLSPSWCAQAVQHGKRRPPRHGRATKHWTKPRDLFEGRGWKTRPPHQKTAAMAMNIAQTAQHRRVGHRCTHPPDGTLLQHKPCRYIHPQPTTHHPLGSHLCLVAAGCPEGVHIKLPKVSLCHFPAVCLWTSRRTILKFISLANPSDIFAFFFIKLSASVAKGPGSELARVISSPSPCRFLLVTSPREERGGGVCLSTTALRIPLPDPSSPRAPIPEWRVPAQRPSSPDELQTRHVTGCHSWYPPPDPLQTTSSLHRNVLGLSPNGQPCRKCGWQALGPLPSSMHAALLIPALAFQIRESAWPCWDMAELWRPPSMATMMPPLLAALPCSPCAAAERTMYEARPIFTGTSSPQLRADKIHPSAIVQLEP